MRALEIQGQEEEEEKKGVKQKMLHLADLMQYEDDFDDTIVPTYNTNKKKDRFESDSSDD